MNVPGKKSEEGRNEKETYWAYSRLVDYSSSLWIFSSLSVDVSYMNVPEKNKTKQSRNEKET